MTNNSADKSRKRFLIVACLFFLTAIITGASLKHEIANNLGEFQNAFDTAYFFHYLAGISLFCLIANPVGRTRLYLSINALGSLIFVGSLYTYVFTEIKVFSYATSVGGVLLISSWLIYLWLLLRADTEDLA